MDRLLSSSRLAGRAKDKAAGETPQQAAVATPSRAQPGALSQPPPPLPSPSPPPASPSPSPSPTPAACFARPKRAAIAASVLSASDATTVAASAAASTAAASAPAISPAEAAACAAAAAKMRLGAAGASPPCRARALVAAALAANPLLRDLTPAAIDAVVDSMRPRCVPSGRDIITQGDKNGRELFVLESGAAEVRVVPADGAAAAAASPSPSNPQPPPPTKVLDYGPGASFGELALMYSAPRAATVRAAGGSSGICRLWVADRAVVATVRRHWAAREQHDRVEACGRVRAFADLGDAARQRLAEAMRVVVLKPGERLFARGQLADALFVVRSGGVVVTAGEGEGEGEAESDATATANLPPLPVGGGGDDDPKHDHDDETEGFAGPGVVLAAGPALRAQECEAARAADEEKKEKETASASSSSSAAKPTKKTAAAATATNPPPPPPPSSCRHALGARASRQGAELLALRTKDLAALLGGAPLTQVARCEALRRCAALSGAGDARLWALAKRSESRCGFGKGDVVFRAGDAPDCFYVVVEGMFECRAAGGGAGGGRGASGVLATVGPGQCFGERGLIEAAKEGAEEDRRLEEEAVKEAEAAQAAAAAAKGSKKSAKASSPSPSPPSPTNKRRPLSPSARRQATVVCASARGRLVAVGSDAFASLLADLPSLRALWREGALRRVPLFDALSSRERAAVASALRPIEVKAGEAVVVQGERGEHFFVIERGTLDACRRPDGKREVGGGKGGGGAGGGGGGGNGGNSNHATNADDEEDDIGDIGSVVRSYGAGDYFGELALLSERSLRAATVVARTDSSLLALGSAAFAALLPAAVRGALREAAAAYTGRRTARPGWPSTVRLADLEEVGVLGCGGFGRVSLVRLREGCAALALGAGGGGGGGGGCSSTSSNSAPPPPKFMALKAMWKSHIVASQLTTHVHRERDAMLEVAMAGRLRPLSSERGDDEGDKGGNGRSNSPSSSSFSSATTTPSPWLVTLHASFSDDRRVYLLMDACPGGELFSYLRTRPRAAGPLPEAHARFLVAGVALALRELHGRGLVYRDLKPENVLLDARGYPRLADFGFVKRVPPGGRTHTLCGTPEYLAPELVERRGHWQAADWWALGVLAYELCAGQPPFYARDPVAMYALIREARPRFPKSMSPELRDFCARLLHRTPALRLGAAASGGSGGGGSEGGEGVGGGAADVLSHAWFEGFDWRAFETGTMPAPYVPPEIVVAGGGGGAAGGGRDKMTAAALVAAAQAEAEMAATGLAGNQYRYVPYESAGDFADF